MSAPRAMGRFRGQAEAQIVGRWKHQCYCGDTAARWYRRRWWCATYGREQRALHSGMGQCGCALCHAMENLPWDSIWTAIITAAVSLAAFAAWAVALWLLGDLTSRLMR